MPFQKNNKLWQKGLAVKKAKQEKIDEFFIVTQLGGRERYLDLLQKLADGEDLSKGQIEFMDRYEKLWPYVKAKYSSVDQKTTIEGEVDQNISIEFVNGKSKTS